MMLTMNDDFQEFVRDDPAGGQRGPHRPRRALATWLAVGLVAASIAVLIVAWKPFEGGDHGQVLSPPDQSSSPSGIEVASTAAAPTEPAAAETTATTETPATPATPATTPVTSAANNVIVDVLGPGAWQGARTTGDGFELLLFIVGGPDFDAADPCSVAYVPIVEEMGAEVRVRINGEYPPPTDPNQVCPSLGYLRTVQVPLENPFGTRTLVALGEARGVFDGSTLVQPTWIPEGWSAGLEGPGYPDPRSSLSWSRSWAPPPAPNSGQSCTPSQSGFTLVEGPSDLVDRFPTESGETNVGDYDVNGATATYSTQVDHGIAWITWKSGDRGFVLKSSPACLGDQPAPLETMLQFARALMIPSTVAGD
jgi:hypothetical protein